MIQIKSNFKIVWLILDLISYNIRSSHMSTNIYIYIDTHTKQIYTCFIFYIWWLPIWLKDNIIAVVPLLFPFLLITSINYTRTYKYMQLYTFKISISKFIYITSTIIHLIHQTKNPYSIYNSELKKTKLLNLLKISW